ncbi:HYR domain-containing protein, partial [Mariniflexile sp.]|uniref:HYR domain-containing protein n=1 Tax=Mariniflexile sp. TaxID=1979402 RepID=UPI00404847A1
MKNFTHLTNIHKALHLAILLLGFASFAQIQKQFTPRYDTTIRGNMAVIANNVLSRTATGNYNGTGGNHDFNDNVYVDIDSDNTTFNSSSANFSNPEPTLACVTIRKAYLYWAAADKEKDDGSDNQPLWNYNNVKLMLPGASTYSTLVADDVIFRGRNTHFSNDPYICVKDISTLVTALANPYGTYQVANIEAKTGSLTSHGGGNTGTSGGWQIVFVYESPLLSAKNITLFDGYAHVTKTTNNFDIKFSGFKTVTNGPVKANVVMGALEGDRDLFGDMLQIKNVAGNWINLSITNRPFDNFFNSKITFNGADFTNRNPVSLNTLGFDSAMFSLDNPNNTLITNNQTEATIRLTSNHETYGLYLLGLSVDVWEPSIKPLMLSLNAANTTQNPGDIVPFKFYLKNKGNDDIVDLKIFTTLPPQLSLSSAITLPSGVTYSYNTLTRYLEFKVANGLMNVGLPEILVNLNLQVANACYFLTNDCNLNVPLQFTAEYHGIYNIKKQTTLSSRIINDCEVGDELPTPIVIKQPVANWKTLPKALNRTVECNNSEELATAQSLMPETDTCTFTIKKVSGPFVPSTCGGTYTNTFTFTDACGVNCTTFTQTITVIDTTPPTGTAPDDIYGIQCIDNIPVANIEAVTDEADTCGPVTVTVSDTNNGGLGTTSNPYVVTRTYRLTDACGNYRDLVQKITAVDNTNPTIACPSNSSVNVDNNSCEALATNVNLGTPTASDNCSAVTLTNNAPLSFPLGTTTVTWTATDASGNTATCEQTVTVTDNMPPIFVSCAAPVSVTVDTDSCEALATNVNLGTPTASDNCSAVTLTNNAPLSFPLGTTTVT